MSKTRQLSDLLDSNGDVVAGALDNAPDPDLTPYAELSGDTFTGAVNLEGGANFGDNDKAIFGAGSDLQIYHDGSNSYISEPTGDGNLKIQATNLNIQRHDGTETYIDCTGNGDVTLYHNGSPKLATTSTGVSVTGDLSVSGSISGAGKVLQVKSTTKTSHFSTSSSGYVDISGLSVSITPSSTSSKILVTVNGFCSPDGDDRFGYAVLVRNGSQIAIGNSRGNAQRTTMDLSQQRAGTTNVWAKHFGVTYLDSPSTTSALTYKVQMKVTNGGWVGIGGTGNTSDGNRSNTPTMITVMEIAG